MMVSSRGSGVSQRHLTEAAVLVEKSLVWDNHSCMPLRPADWTFLPRLAELRAAAFDVVSLNVGFGPQGVESHLAMLDSFAGWIATHQDAYAIVRSISDIEECRRSGRLGIFFDVEGMGPLDQGRIDLVESFRRKGVGWMLVAYNLNNDAGGGCYGDDHGLSGYGREVLAEMKRVGMIVCCSHTGHRTAMEVIEHAGNPVIFSHSNPNACHSHERNIPDSLIMACAANGGVIGINGIGPFLGGDGATPTQVVRHIDHVIQLVGPDHVGLGLDYVFDMQELVDYMQTMRETFPDDATYRQDPDFLHPNRTVQIVAGLLELGYPGVDIAKLLGSNWLRVAGAVWR